MTLLTTLTQLERILHCPASLPPTDMAALLHPAFMEFGTSGRITHYAEAQVWVTQPQAGTMIHAQNFTLQWHSTEAALLTYRSVNQLADGQLVKWAHRSSLWQHSLAGWQMRFHQGSTATPFSLVDEQK